MFQTLWKIKVGTKQAPLLTLLTVCVCVCVCVCMHAHAHGHMCEHVCMAELFNIHLKKLLIYYLFMAAWGLHCCVRAFL